MIEAGFEDEMKALYAREELHPELPSIRCVGYRQMWGLLDGNCDLDEAAFPWCLCNLSIG
ncbi:hypothetical protein O9929_01240 [Vibrio lentus]|nr:hypothetical protein [Vibrio lentus]